MRIAPLLVFADGQRQRGIEHRVDHVDERNFGDDRLEEIRAQVGHRAHQQTAGTAAFDHELAGLRVALCDQVLGAGDEIGEGVALVQHASLIVPALAQFAAAANVRDRDNHATVEQPETRRAEVDGDGEP